jgi:hypothetical protein
MKLTEKDLELAKAINEDKVMTINGRDYQMTAFNHATRKQVFGLYEALGHKTKAGAQTVATPEWNKLEDILSQRFLYDGMAIDKLTDHWDKYGEDYLTFMNYAMQAVCYPFLKGSLTN